MNSVPSAVALAAALPAPDLYPAVAAAAELLQPPLQKGQAISADTLRAAMGEGFGGSDAEGIWDWKTAYDVCEVAQLLFLRRLGGGSLGIRTLLARTRRSYGTRNLCNLREGNAC